MEFEANVNKSSMLLISKLVVCGSFLMVGNWVAAFALPPIHAPKVFKPLGPHNTHEPPIRSFPPDASTGSGHEHLERGITPIPDNNKVDPQAGTPSEVVKPEVRPSANIKGNTGNSTLTNAPKTILCEPYEMSRMVDGKFKICPLTSA